MAEHTRGPRTRYALSTMLRALTFVAFACLSTSLPPVVAHAQAVDEARAEALRARAREAVAAGRLEEAFGHVRVAAELSGDPTVWLEVATVAERLRMDALVVEALHQYLERRPDAPDRAEVEGRLRVLDALARGGRYQPEEDGRTVRLVVEWDGGAVVTRRRPAASGRPLNVLVDWQGRPLVVRRSSELLSLAEWDGRVRTRASLAGRELFPFPAEAAGLGRRLDAPASVTR